MLMNKSSTEEKRFSIFQRYNGRFDIFFYVLLWQKISHCGINTFVPPMHTHEPEIWSMFRGYHLCSLDAFVGWLWYINRSKGFLKVTVLTPFSRAYVQCMEKGEPSHLLCFKLERICFLCEVGLNESSMEEKEFVSSKDPLEDTDHT